MHYVGLGETIDDGVTLEFGTIEHASHPTVRIEAAVRYSDKVYYLETDTRYPTTITYWEATNLSNSDFSCRLLDADVKPRLPDYLSLLTRYVGTTIVSK